MTLFEFVTESSATPPCGHCWIACRCRPRSGIPHRLGRHVPRDVVGRLTPLGAESQRLNTFVWLYRLWSRQGGAISPEALRRLSTSAPAPCGYKPGETIIFGYLQLVMRDLRGKRPISGPRRGIPRRHAPTARNGRRLTIELTPSVAPRRANSSGGRFAATAPTRARCAGATSASTAAARPPSPTCWLVERRIVDRGFNPGGNPERVPRRHATRDPQVSRTVPER